MVANGVGRLNTGIPLVRFTITFDGMVAPFPVVDEVVRPSSEDDVEGVADRSSALCRCTGTRFNNGTGLSFFANDSDFPFFLVARSFLPYRVPPPLEPLLLGTYLIGPCIALTLAVGTGAARLATVLKLFVRLAVPVGH